MGNLQTYQKHQFSKKVGSFSLLWVFLNAQTEEGQIQKMNGYFA